MKYNLTSPCNNCPFRNDIKPFIRPERVEEIVGNQFACHKTAVHNDDGEHIENDREQHCAGSLIFHEKIEQPHQMMRIMERLGGYDHSELNMESPVYESLEEMISDHEIFVGRFGQRA